MPERVSASQVNSGCIREAVTIDTKKVYDACRDKDCIEDLRVYLTDPSQEAVENATSLKPKSAELLYASVDVESTAYSKGYYTVYIRYYYRITADTNSCGRGTQIEGYATFKKRVMLYGGEGGTKSFSSFDNDTKIGCGTASVLPEAVVEALDPIILDIKLVERCHCKPDYDNELSDIPAQVLAAFDDLLTRGDGEKQVYVTLGQFSTVRLQRSIQLLIPVYDISLPDKECVCTPDEPADPCDIFRNIQFPTEQFIPPDSVSDTAEADTDEEEK
ncbi:MAG: hypothetical protein ACOX7P_04990 [Oscillospiraceae bacterium]|jgi:hypothetical protein